MILDKDNKYYKNILNKLNMKKFNKYYKIKL